MFTESNVPDQWNSYSEEELWVKYVGGNRKAYSILFLRCYERLFRYGMQFSSREEIVKDSIQKLFLRLWKNREELACPQSVYGYLYVSLRRILLRRDRRKKSRVQRHSDFMEEEPYWISSIEQMIINQEENTRRKELFQFALQELSPRQKEALLLRIDSGMSNGEIANIMDVSGKRVRNLIYEATKRLKKEIHALIS